MLKTVLNENCCEQLLEIESMDKILGNWVLPCAFYTL